MKYLNHIQFNTEAPTNEGGNAEQPSADYFVPNEVYTSLGEKPNENIKPISEFNKPSEEPTTTTDKTAVGNVDTNYFSEISGGKLNSKEEFEAHYKQLETYSKEYEPIRNIDVSLREKLLYVSNGGTEQEYQTLQKISDISSLTPQQILELDIELSNPVLAEYKTELAGERANLLDNNYIKERIEKEVKEAHSEIENDDNYDDTQKANLKKLKTKEIVEAVQREHTTAKTEFEVSKKALEEKFNELSKYKTNSQSQVPQEQQKAEAERVETEKWNNYVSGVTKEVNILGDMTFKSGDVDVVFPLTAVEKAEIIGFATDPNNVNQVLALSEAHKNGGAVDINILANNYIKMYKSDVILSRAVTNAKENFMKSITNSGTTTQTATFNGGDKGDYVIPAEYRTGK